MKPTQEELMAYADGELDGDAAARVAAAVTADTALAERVATHRRLRGRLRDAYDPVLGQPVPLRLQAAAARLAKAQRDATAGPSPVARRRAWPAWTALAASLVAAVLLARMLPTESTVPGIGTRVDGDRVAVGALADSLEAQVSGGPPGGDAVSLHFSFRATDGRPCRTFVLHGDKPLAGLACRETEAWHVDVLVDAPQAQAAEMRMASSALPPLLLEVVDARIAGEPLDAAQEDAAIRAGWR